MSLIPSNQTIYGNLNVAGSITSFTNQVPTDPFGDIRVVQKSSYLELKSTFGVSQLRDLVTTTGTGSVLNTLVGLGGSGEYQVSVSAANDVATLQSQERGCYIAGYGVEVGVGIRMPVPPTGNTVSRWGLYDDANGVYFTMSAAGPGVGIMRNGVETLTPRSAWNVDKMDGTGPSGYTLNMARGNIFQIVFSWYGYGAIVYRVVVTDSVGNQIVQVVHRGVNPNSTSMTTPNLPITITVQNGATASDHTVNVGGRQYSILGNFPARTFRISTAYIVASTGYNKTSFTPVISVKRKNGYVGNAIRIHNLEISASNDCYYEIRLNAVLGGIASSWANLPSTVASETALQQDTSATTATGGVVLYAGYLPSNAGANTKTDNDDIEFMIEEHSVITVVARGAPSGLNSTTVNCFLRFKEAW